MDKTAKQNSEAVTTEGGTAAGIFPGGVLPQAVLHRRWFLPEASNTPPEAECAESPAELLALKKTKKAPRTQVQGALIAFELYQVAFVWELREGRA